LKSFRPSTSQFYFSARNKLNHSCATPNIHDWISRSECRSQTRSAGYDKAACMHAVRTSQPCMVISPMLVVCNETPLSFEVHGPWCSRTPDLASILSPASGHRLITLYLLFSRQADWSSFEIPDYRCHMPSLPTSPVEGHPSSLQSRAVPNSRALSTTERSHLPPILCCA